MEWSTEKNGNRTAQTLILNSYVLYAEFIDKHSEYDIKISVFNHLGKLEEHQSVTELTVGLDEAQAYFEKLKNRFKEKYKIINIKEEDLKC